MSRKLTEKSGKLSAAADPPTLEALVTVCNGEGALLHGQLVKFSELLKQLREEEKTLTNEKK